MDQLHPREYSLPLEISAGDFDLTSQNRALLAQGYQRPDGKAIQPVAYRNLSSSRRRSKSLSR